MRTAEVFQPVKVNAGTTILALDAAGGACSVAIGRVEASGLRLLAADRREMQHGHAAVLVPMIAAAMAAAGLAMERIDVIAAGIGPGGFTGLRIALATARGLALALGKPVVGISNFQASAANLPAGATIPGNVVVLIDSRRADPYAALLGPDLALRAAPSLMSGEEIAGLIAAAGDVILTGDGVTLWQRPLPQACRVIPASADAAAILRLAAAGEGRFQMPPLPCYLRAPDVSLPRDVPLAGAV